MVNIGLKSSKTFSSFVIDWFTSLNLIIDCGSIYSEIRIRTAQLLRRITLFSTLFQKWFQQNLNFIHSFTK